MKIKINVDGVQYRDEVEPRTLLVHYLREQLGKVGTVVGCDTSNCGACTVDLDGAEREELHRARRPGRRRRGHHDRGAGRTAQLHPMQQAFHENHALQCGYCTPGMIMAARDLLQEQPEPQRGRDPRGHRGQPVPLHGLPNIVRGQSQAAEPAAGGYRHDRSCDDRAARPRSASRASARRTHHLITGRTTWTDNIDAAGHAAPGDPAQPDGARHDHRDRRQRGEAPSRRRRASSPARTSRTARAACRAPGRSPRTWSTRARRRIAVDQVQLRRRDRRGRRRPHQGRGAGRARGDRGRLRRRCPPSSTWRRPSRTAPPLVHPTPTSNKIYTWVFESGAGRHRRADRARRSTTPR